MFATVLIWQALIFASIAISGRWRWWIVTFWCAWTLVQVSGLPLSALQFSTIAISAALFRKQSPSPREAEPPVLQFPVKRSRTSARQAEQIHGEPSLLHKLEKLSADMERKSIELSKEVIFRAEASQHIKESGFSCEIEKRVMQEEFAKDEAISFEIQKALASDPLLNELYCKLLANSSLLAEKRGDKECVAVRQDREKLALEMARFHMGQLNDLMNKGHHYRQSYYAAQESLFLQENKRAPSEQEKAEMQLLFGRRIEDWVVELNKRRRSDSVYPSSAANPISA